MINIKRLTIFLLGVTFFLTTDVVAQKINQVNTNGKKTGIWRKYYPNKRIRYQGQFNNGKEVGVFKFYDVTSSKHPVIIKEYSKKSDTALVKFYTIKGKLRSKGAMIGKNRVGKWIYYFIDTGKLFSEEFYNNGKLEGKLVNYYPNGKITEETFYKNGLKNGVSKKFTDNGTLLEEVTFVNNKLEGEAKYYDLKGNLKERGIYKSGKRYGKWEFYMEGEKVSDKKRQKTHRIKTK